MKKKCNKKGFRLYMKRFLAVLLVIMLIGQMQTGSLIINGIQSLSLLVSIRRKARR